MRSYDVLKGCAWICLASLAGCASSAPDFAQFETPLPEHGFAIGPDGAYVTRHDRPWGQAGKQQILFAPDAQTPPRPPAFADPESSESDFYFSAALHRGCFVSDRPAPALPQGPNIWCVKWSKAGWGSPFALPPPVNSEANEFSPVLRVDGSLYFASDREGGAGLGDIYLAQPAAMGWSVYQLGETVNSTGGEWNLDISPNGNAMIFEASHRKQNMSAAGDLYVSFKIDVAWGPARPLTRYNTGGSELMARFIDEETFIYAQSIDGDVILKTGRLPPGAGGH